MTAEEKCKEFKSLSNEAKALYVCILIQSRGGREFSFAIEGCAEVLGYTEYTKARNELTKKGFIE